MIALALHFLTSDQPYRHLAFEILARLCSVLGGSAADAETLMQYKVLERRDGEEMLALGDMPLMPPSRRECVERLPFAGAAHGASECTAGVGASGAHLCALRGGCVAGGV